MPSAKAPAAMFQRSFLVAIVAFLLGALSPRASSAETLASGEARAARSSEAVERYREGRAAFDAHEYRRAIRSFLDADRLAPSAALSFNIARSYEKLGNVARALEHYRSYLRREPGGTGAKRAAERVRQLEAALQRRGVQQVSVTSTPAGATVEVDRRTLGVTPWTGELTPGDHTLVLSHDGYAKTTRRIAVAPDRAIDVEVALARAVEGGGATVIAARPSPARRPSFKERAGPWPFVTLGASAVAFGVAGAYELERSDAAAEARLSRTQLEYAARREEAESRQATARVFAGVGGGLALLGGVLLGVALLDDDSPPERDGAATARWSLDCGATACAAHFLERF